MVRSNEPANRPCAVVAHSDAAGAAETGRRLRRLGWDVYEASEGPEVRRLARMLEADLVVLDVALAQESGWLTCANLAEERPNGKVILLGEASPRNQERARFVGACAIVPCQDSLATWMTLGWERTRAA